MDDQDLKILKEIEAPLPRPAAREAAMRAGLQAFDQAGEEKILTTAKGSRNPLRLISSSLNHALDWTMKHQAFVGFALVAVVAVPVAFGVLREADDSKGASPIATTLSMSSPEPKSDGERAPVADVLALPAAPPKTTAGQGASTALVERARKQRSDARARSVQTGGILDMRAPVDSAARPKARRSAALRKTQPSVRRTVRKPSKRGEQRLASGIFQEPNASAVVRESRDRFATFANNPLKDVSIDPVSTFSIDVDTASYAYVRKSIQQGRLPRRAAVRTEEMVNYFSYNYPGPTSSDVPFKATTGVFPTPWNPETKLIHIGIKGYDIEPTQKPRSNLVFLLDVSGSMNAPDKLPLLKSAFRLLVDQLDDEDTVSIVTYAGRAGTILTPTKVRERGKILGALDQLRSGGSTAGAQGIQQAYALAEQNFQKGGVNRVILATDGDFNVGIVDPSTLKDYIARKRKSGVFLSILGFGSGNYNDALMQTLAQNGNGNAAYIDTLQEAHKVLVEEAGSTLFPIAKDVKIQIEFNPKRVSEYRLIGYESRALANEDFNNDKVDAGDIGSGHTVTAIYEITPVGAKRQGTDPLRYQSAGASEPKSNGTEDAGATEYAFLKLRYKLPHSETSKLVSQAVTTAQEVDRFSQVSTDMRFAVSVAGFAEIMRGAERTGDFNLDQIADLATDARGEDRFGYRNEFVRLVRLAEALRNASQVPATAQ